MNTAPMFPRPASRTLAALSTGMVALAATLALASGCTVEDELSALEAEPDLEEIERDGLVYDRIGPVVEQPVEPGPDAVIRPLDEPIVEPEQVAPALDTWSREELADKLRPVLAGADGNVYLAREPAWDAADAVLDSGAESFAVDLLDRSGEGRPSIEPADETAFRQIIGSDGRSYVANTMAAPHNAIVKLELYTGNTYRGFCTGSYIGPWTLITAGHCLVFSNTDRVNRIVFQPARNGPALPYGQFDCRLDDGNSSNDYLWSVPAGYYTGQAGQLDYAVIDTWPCHGAPAWFGGYQANAGNSTFSTHGYPGDTCPGAPGPMNYQCGMSGPATINDWRMETQHIDTMGGQSGMPWYRTYDIARPIGTHVGYREYFDLWKCGFDVCRRNFARRIDNAFNQFIIDVAWDY